MAVDPELVRRKTRLILEDLARLALVSAKDVKDYLADPLHEIVAERLLERIIARMIDINYHLCVESGGMPPKDYHESFLRLADLGVLPRERADDLSHAAGLRNRLAHEYNGLDERLVHAAARAVGEQAHDYLRAVEEYVIRIMPGA